MRVGHFNDTFVLIVIIAICITAMTIVTLYMVRSTQNTDEKNNGNRTRHYCPQCGCRLVIGKYEPRVRFGKAQPFYALICTECKYISPVGTHIKKEAESEFAAFIQGRTDFEYITDHDTTIQIQEFGLEEQMVHMKNISEATDSAREKVRESKVGKGISGKVTQYTTSHRAKEKLKELRNSTYPSVSSSSNSDEDKIKTGGKPR